MIQAYQGIRPRIHPSAFIEASASVIGDVEIGAQSSVWFQVVIRADVNLIRIGERANLQDGCVVHVTYQKWPTFIGSETTLGHGAIIHGVRVGNNCLIGMGSILLDGAEIGDQAIVGAGALVPPGLKVPSRTLVMGVPARPVREVSEADLEMMTNQFRQYLRLAEEYREASDVSRNP